MTLSIELTYLGSDSSSDDEEGSDGEHDQCHLPAVDKGYDEATNKVSHKLHKQCYLLCHTLLDHCNVAVTCIKSP